VRDTTVSTSLTWHGVACRFDPSQDGGTSEVEFAVATSRAKGNSRHAPRYVGLEVAFGTDAAPVGLGGGFCQLFCV